MSLIRWEPFAGVDDLFARMPGMLGWPRAFEAAGGRSAFTPAIDISETDTEYLIRAELPAMKKEEVNITVDERMLTVSGERKQRFEDKKEKSHRVETVYGSFSRSFSLPDNADVNSIRAESSDGVITIHVAKTKAEARKPTQIKVQ